MLDFDIWMMKINEKVKMENLTSGFNDYKYS